MRDADAPPAGKPATAVAPLDAVPELVTAPAECRPAD
jgi:hypothetical protein